MVQTSSINTVASNHPSYVDIKNFFNNFSPRPCAASSRHWAISVITSSSDACRALSFGLFSNPNSDNTAGPTTLPFLVTPSSSIVPAGPCRSWQWPKSSSMLFQNPLLLLNSMSTSVCVFPDWSKTAICTCTQNTCTWTSRKVSFYMDKPLLQDRTTALQGPQYSKILFISAHFHILQKTYTLYHVQCPVLSDRMANTHGIVNWDVHSTLNLPNFSQENSKWKAKSPAIHNCFPIYRKWDAVSVQFIWIQSYIENLSFSFFPKIEIQFFPKHWTPISWCIIDFIWAVMVVLSTAISVSVSGAFSYVLPQQYHYNYRTVHNNGFTILSYYDVLTFDMEHLQHSLHNMKLI